MNSRETCSISHNLISIWGCHLSKCVGSRSAIDFENLHLHNSQKIQMLFFHPSILVRICVLCSLNRKKNCSCFIKCITQLIMKCEFQGSDTSLNLQRMVTFFATVIWLLKVIKIQLQRTQHKMKKNNNKNFKKKSHHSFWEVSYLDFLIFSLWCLAKFQMK